jgi:hypothetical protein
MYHKPHVCETSYPLLRGVRGGTRCNNPFTVFNSWNRSTSCRNLNNVRVCSGYRGSRTPFTMTWTHTVVKPPTVQHIIYNIKRVVWNSCRPQKTPRQYVTWSSSSPPQPPQEKASTSYPKMTPHQIFHHQCTDPGIDSMVSPHPWTQVYRTPAKDSHPKPANEHAPAPSGTCISNPPVTVRSG